MDIKYITFFLEFLGERTHQIPVEGLAKKDDTYRKIWLDLLRFVNPEQTAIFPPVYSRVCIVRPRILILLFARFNKINYFFVCCFSDFRNETN